MDVKHRKLCRRYDIAGDAHFLTYSCFHRLPLFSKDRTRTWMLRAFQLGREKNQYDLWSFVIMPEHVHAVLLPHPGVKISEILTMLKQSVSKRALIWLKNNHPEFLVRLEDRQPNGKRSYRFWQRGGGYDRNLRSLSDIYEKILYVHGNPVRRGLTIVPEDWSWSSCLAWQTGKDFPIAIDRDSLPPLMPNERRYG
ncbi:MAG: transposase [Pirellulales bacterium]|nr:transposase [Pirellulales bacterium]